MMAETSNGKAEPSAYDRRLGQARPWLTATAVVLNLLIFSAANSFWRYLGAGRWFDFRPVSYYQDLTTPLGEVFRHPLDLLMHPWMILVAGLLLGVIVFVPVVFAVLYRTRLAAAFVVVVVLLGHAPVLALATGIGCALGGRTRLRHDMPLLAVILGLLPAGAYLALSALAGVDSSAVLPLQRWALYAPFVICFVSAVLAAAGALGIARLTKVRPGAILPVCLVVLAGPVTIFFLRIGPDKLDYALIVDRLQPGDAIFEEAALRPWVRRHSAEGLSPTNTLVRVSEDLQTRRDALAAACRRFLRKHPHSEQRPSILWLRAEAMSLQLDEAAFGGGLIKYSASFPLPASAEAWEDLRAQCPNTPQVALAQWRLGELALRAVAQPNTEQPGSLVRKAEEHLHKAAELLTEALSADAGGEELDRPRMFLPTPDLPGREYCRGALETIQRRLWTIEQNDVLTDANSAEALGAFLDLNPQLPDYYQRLSSLLSDPEAKREKTKMGDNLKLEIARELLRTRTKGDIEKESKTQQAAEMLILLAQDERTDSAIVANFELGNLALQTTRSRALPLVRGIKTPEEYFRLVIVAPPNPYRLKAEEMLANLAGRPETRP